METFFKRYGWIVHLTVIALIAVLIGWSVNKAIAIQLAPYTVPEIVKIQAPASSSRPKSRTNRSRNFKTTIVNRCLFECADATPAATCEGGCGDNEVCQNGSCVPLSPAAPLDSEMAVESDMSIKLMGAMVARKPEYSLGLLNEGGSTFIVGIGDTIGTENAEVLEIRRDRIIIKRNGRKEYIKLANSIGGAPSARSTALTSLSPAATDIKTNRPKIPSLDSAKKKASSDVKEVAKNTFEIDKAALNRELGDAEKLAKQARIVPNYKNGKTHGIKMIGVESSSAYGKLGIKNGDIVLSINGSKITSQARALELIQSLRGSSKMSIQVERKGKTETFKYNVK